MPRRRESFTSKLLARVNVGLPAVCLLLVVGSCSQESNSPTAPVPTNGAVAPGREAGASNLGAPTPSTDGAGDSGQAGEAGGLSSSSATDRLAAQAKSKAEGGSPRLQLLVPAYFYPSGQDLDFWDRLIRGAARAPIVVVANPGSGPGENPDANYVAIIRRATEQGVTVIGYVNTKYGKRPQAEIQAEIDRWTRFYPAIRGIFFDAQAAEADRVDFYAALRKYAGGKIERALVVTNPGTLCAEEFFSRPATDVACVFALPEGFERFRLPAWSDRYPPSSFAALPFGIVSPEAMRDAVRLAVRGRIGFLYVTDGVAPDTWSRLPRYWEAEVDAVRRVNQRQEP